MLKDIADAQLLYMGFDEDGVFRIHARDYMSPDTQARPDLTITAARDLAQIITSEEIDGIANIVEVAPTAYEFQSLSAEDFYTDDTVREIPPRGTLRVSLDTTGRGWMTPCPMPFSTSGSGTPDASRVKFLTKEGSWRRWKSNSSTPTRHSRRSSITGR
ncbi:hypothetical protein CDO52_26950 [Nocardiopsis gilva YIM 90087]|uniref:Uncharacterized protein n=1 Tax=Nocardiopsis gilva YIM 90087 TaxID=1235441 RepID=A0A223SCS3_9ACTN|nr:hypothetical protein [Nocardiopsis gilva]ASU85947.1 hypothetical protein CDO52_26950 [Nocardiopsis gilva YIM 90087]